MPRSASIFALALCSPMGLEADREAVRAAVQEVNRFIAPEGRQIEVKGWDTDVRPTIGADAQQVVNREIIESADIGVVLIGDFVGSATPRSPSGTVEEARSFIARKKSGESVDLLLYFKRLPVRYDRTTIERMTAVVEFREEMQAAGVFWREYETEVELAESIRTHLPTSVRSLNPASVAILESDLNSSGSNLHPAVKHEIEEGMLDQEIAFADAMAILNDAAMSIGEGARQATAKMEIVTREFSQANTEERDPRRLRKLVNTLSDVLDEYAEMMRGETDKIESSADIAVNATISMVGFAGSDELIGDAQSLTNLGTSISEARSGMDAMAASTFESAKIVEGLPKMTKELNAAKRRVVAESARLENAARRFSERLLEVENVVKERAASLAPKPLLPGLGG